VSRGWSSDDELFAQARRELFTAVVGDAMDKLDLYHQFLPPEIQPLREDMVMNWARHAGARHGCFS
jgi:hypothetical protein